MGSLIFSLTLNWSIPTNTGDVYKGLGDSTREWSVCVWIFVCVEERQRENVTDFYTWSKSSVVRFKAVHIPDWHTQGWTKDSFCLSRCVFSVSHWSFGPESPVSLSWGGGDTFFSSLFLSHCNFYTEYAHPILLLFGEFFVPIFKVKIEKCASKLKVWY